MSKKLVLVIILFIISIGIYIFLNVFYLNDSKIPAQSSKKIISSPINDVSFYFLPEFLTLISGQSGSLNIVIKQTSSQISSKIIQLELSFEPGTIYNLNIYPGNYLLNPEVLYEKIDMKNGRISYALQGINQRGKDIIASISFTVSSYGVQKDTKIEFQPKTLIKDENGNTKLSQTSNATILVKPSFLRYIPVASASPFTINQ